MTDLSTRGERDADLFLSVMPDLIFVFDEEGRIQAIHTLDPSLLAAPPEVLRGRRIADFFPASVVADFDSRFATVRSGAVASPMRYEVPGPAGARTFEGRFSHVGDGRVLVACRDVTADAAALAEQGPELDLARLLARVRAAAEKGDGPAPLQDALGEVERAATRALEVVRRLQRPVVAEGPRLVALVVDDEAPVRRAAARLLRQDGHEPVEAEDGFVAERVVRTRAVDVVLLDLTMAARSGEETFRALRGLAPTLPIVFSSGYAEDVVRKRAPGDEASQLLPKPYTRDEFRAALRWAAERRSLTRPGPG